MPLSSCVVASLLLALATVVASEFKGCYSSEPGNCMEYVDITPWSRLREKNNKITYLLPIYCSHTLDTFNSTIKNLVVVVPDTDRRAWVTYSQFWTSESLQAVARDTAFITPYFTCQNDKSRPADETQFDCSGWVTGHYAWHPPTAFLDGVSTFSALDSIVLTAKSVFRNLEKITISGFGGGGEFVQRYAMLNEVDGKLASLKFRYLVGAPSVYMYPTADRLQPGKCKSMDICTIQTRGDFRPPSYAGCPSFNDYRYGVEDLDYHTMYGARYNSSFPSNAAARITTFANRDVRYFAGDMDTEVHDLDTNCEAEFQGNNRLVRAITFYAYVSFVLGKEHPLMIFTSTGHDAKAVFSNPGWIMSLLN